MYLFQGHWSLRGRGAIARPVFLRISSIYPQKSLPPPPSPIFQNSWYCPSCFLELPTPLYSTGNIVFEQFFCLYCLLLCVFTGYNLHELKKQRTPSLFWYHGLFQIFWLLTILLGLTHHQGNLRVSLNHTLKTKFLDRCI